MQLYANRLCVCVCIERDSWEENLLELCNKKSNITLMYELAYLLILFFKKGYHFIHLLSLVQFKVAEVLLLISAIESAWILLIYQF